MLFLIEIGFLRKVFENTDLVRNTSYYIKKKTKFTNFHDFKTGFKDHKYKKILSGLKKK